MDKWSTQTKIYCKVNEIEILRLCLQFHYKLDMYVYNILMSPCQQVLIKDYIMCKISASIIKLKSQIYLNNGSSVFTCISIYVDFGYILLKHHVSYILFLLRGNTFQTRCKNIIKITEKGNMKKKKEEKILPLHLCYVQC